MTFSSRSSVVAPRSVWAPSFSSFSSPSSCPTRCKGPINSFISPNYPGFGMKPPFLKAGGTRGRAHSSAAPAQSRGRCPEEPPEGGGRPPAPRWLRSGEDSWRRSHGRDRAGGRRPPPAGEASPLPPRCCNKSPTAGGERRRGKSCTEARAGFVLVLMGDRAPGRGSGMGGGEEGPLTPPPTERSQTDSLNVSHIRDRLGEQREVGRDMARAQRRPERRRLSHGAPDPTGKSRRLGARSGLISDRDTTRDRHRQAPTAAALPVPGARRVGDAPQPRSALPAHAAPSVPDLRHLRCRQSRSSRAGSGFIAISTKTVNEPAGPPERPAGSRADPGLRDHGLEVSRRIYSPPPRALTAPLQRQLFFAGGGGACVGVCGGCWVRRSRKQILTQPPGFRGIGGVKRSDAG